MNNSYPKYFCQTMKIIRSRNFPPKNFSAINLFGLIIVRKDYGELSDAEKNHESIHTRQMLEMFIILFYLLYVIEWLIRVVEYKNRYEAYKNISYEREAYSNMYNREYLRKRKPYSFIHYYRKEKI